MTKVKAALAATQGMDHNSGLTFHADGRYIEADVRKFYQTLAHQGATQITLIDPSKTRPAVTRYPSSEDDLVAIVERCAGKYMICTGLNERPEPLFNEHNTPRAARDTDVEISSFVFLDFDNSAKAISPALRDERLSYFSNDYIGYVRDLGYREPSLIIDSGSGVHVIHNYGRVRVAQWPDIADRNKKLVSEIEYDLRDLIKELHLHLDTSTTNISTLVKVAGTGKPGQRVSRLMYSQDGQDKELQIHLLSSNLEGRTEAFCAGLWGKSNNSSFQSPQNYPIHAETR